MSQIFPGTGSGSSSTDLTIEKNNSIVSVSQNLNFLSPGVIAVYDSITQKAILLFPDGTTDSFYDNLVLSKSPLVYFKLNKIFATLDNFGSITLPEFGAEPLVKGNIGSVILGTGSNYEQTWNLRDQAEMQMQQNKTVEFWVKFNGGRNEVLTTEYGVHGVIQVRVGTEVIGSTSKRLTLSRFNSGWTSISHPLTLVPGTTYHCVVAWDTNRAYLYVNGVVHSVSGSPWTSFTMAYVGVDQFLNFGKQYTGGAGESYDPISNFAIYPRALTQTEVLEHYNAGNL